MLAIRDAQVAAFAGDGFRRWMEAHLMEFFPERCRAMGPRAVAAAVQAGRDAAAAHGLADDDDVRRYIDVTFALGDGSDDFPWVGEILADPALGAPSYRVHTLEQAALEYLRQRAEGPRV
jgi:hypothetical protein